jgi:hypothetical protein
LSKSSFFLEWESFTKTREFMRVLNLKLNQQGEMIYKVPADLFLMLLHFKALLHFHFSQFSYMSFNESIGLSEKCRQLLFYTNFVYPRWKQARINRSWIRCDKINHHKAQDKVEASGEKGE